MKSSDYVKKFFHSYASGFDAIYGRTEKAGLVGRQIDKMFRKVMFDRMMETLKNTEKDQIQTILDVGCGPGRYCIEFLNQNKKVVALDMAEGMIELAKEATKSHKNSQNIDFVLADYLEYQAPQKFDAAVLMGFFDYIEDPVVVMKKLAQEINHEIYGSFPTSDGFLALQRSVRYKLRNCPLYLYKKSEVEGIMTKAGLNGKYTIQDLGRDYFVKVTL